MALNIWYQKSGFSLGTFQERTQLDIRLPISYGITGVEYTIISGKLPGGLYIKGENILGSAYEVARTTVFTFCIRATKDGEISDRTFNITIEGADAPEFITPPGLLGIGTNSQFFVLESTMVEYQIEAFDPDIATGQHLSYFIESENGVLPPGLILTEDGKIVGFVEPVLSLKESDGTGEYDVSYFDITPYDFAQKSTNGYDSYSYESKYYDYNIPTPRPKKLNRNYEFIVTITDGDTYKQRKFSIFVVSDDWFRADNTYWLNDTGLFVASSTFLKKPIWLTKPNLGTYRANNYIIIFLDVYDKSDIMYEIDSQSNLPPGMIFDYNSSTIYGKVPYQPAITKTFTFTITARRFSDKDEEASSSRTFTMNVIGEIDSIIQWNTESDLGYIDANYISTLKVNATSTIPNAVLIYTVESGVLPPGLTLDYSGEIVGKVNQFYVNSLKTGLTTIDYNTGLTTFDNNTTTIDRKFIFTVKAMDQYGYSANTRTFTLNVHTPDNISYSNIIVKPMMRPIQRELWSTFINDTTIFDPISIYRNNDSNFGIQHNLSMIIYAGIETKTAAEYMSAIGINHKKKRFQFGSIKKAYAIDPISNEIVYETIYIEMIDPLEPNGKVLPSKIKNLQKQHPSITVDLSNDIWNITLDSTVPDIQRPNRIISADSTGYDISNPNPTSYYPSSASIWQKNIKSVGLTERNFLPLWMRSIQPDTNHELGFVLAVPLCFCNVGTADKIMLNIKHSKFNFKSLDYTIDRYIIDSVVGDPTDKYLLFKNDRITI